jgi:hypothetical protein
MWWTRRKPAQLTAPCRDVTGRRREILIFPTDDRRVALAFPSGEVAVLEPLQAGRLRGALRDVIFALGVPEARDQHQHAIPTSGANQ